MLIEKTKSFVKTKLLNNEAGHDWSHIERVYRNALLIAQNENCNLEIVQLAALLHDIADSKFNNGDEEIGPQLANSFLSQENVDLISRTHIIEIIKNCSYKGGHKNSDFNSIELEIIQDADRLDAIGAIGIARTFNYGGYKNRKIFDSEITPNLKLTKEEYKSSTSPTINHFYEKLLLLKDQMNTQTGKKLAEKRHQFMLLFLKNFYEDTGYDPFF